MTRKDTRNIKIACVLHDPAHSYWALCGQGIQDQAREYGITLSVHSVYTNAAAQSEAMDCLYQPGIDAVILAGVLFSFTSSGRAGMPRIPLISCNSIVSGIARACALEPDLRRAAELAATYLVERLHGQGNVIHIQGDLSHGSQTSLRWEGFSAVVSQHPGIAVFEIEGGWNQATTAQSTRALLADNPELHAVYAHTDAMALWSLDVLEAAGRSGLIVVGIDAVPESLAAIHSGRMAATVNLSPYAMGRMALTNALHVVQGRPAPASILTDVHLVTAANLREAMLEAVLVFPNVLRDLVAGNQAQQQLQDEIIAAQQRVIEELSTPIIPVSESVLVVPLIGAIDSLRAGQITAAILEAVSRQRAQVLIIDITGVAVVDTNVINYLLQTANAARLLGTTVLLVGIGPEVAQTIVQLGVDLSAIVTHSTLQAGLEYAEKTLLQRGRSGRGSA